MHGHKLVTAFFVLATCAAMLAQETGVAVVYGTGSTNEETL